MAQRFKIFFLKGFQPRYVALVVGSLTVLLFFAGTHGYYALSGILSPEAFEAVRSDILASTFRLFLVGALYVLVVGVAAMFLAHRSAGPLARLEEELNGMAEGKELSGPVRVREGDDLEPLVSAINKVIDKNKSKEV